MLLIIFFLAGGLGMKYRQNFTEFLLNFRELRIFQKSCRIDRVGILVFQTFYDIVMPCGFLARFRETVTYSRACSDCHVLTSGSGHDNYTIEQSQKNQYFSVKPLHVSSIESLGKERKLVIQCKDYEADKSQPIKTVGKRN